MYAFVVERMWEIGMADNLIMYAIVGERNWRAIKPGFSDGKCIWLIPLTNPEVLKELHFIFFFIHLLSKSSWNAVSAEAVIEFSILCNGNFFYSFSFSRKKNIFFFCFYFSSTILERLLITKPTTNEAVFFQIKLGSFFTLHFCGQLTRSRFILSHGAGFEKPTIITQYSGIG